MITESKLPGVYLIKPKHFEDHRGEYLELYNEKKFDKLIVPFTKRTLQFVEHDLSITTKHALKGIHGDDVTWKLISCLYGKIYLVVLNYDKQSRYYGNWTSFVLSDVNKHQVLIPPRHGNGHVCMSDKSLFYYCQTEYYNLKKQFSVRWNEERFKIWWPIKNPIVSQRDEKGDRRYVER